MGGKWCPDGTGSHGGACKYLALWDTFPGAKKEKSAIKLKQDWRQELQLSSRWQSTYRSEKGGNPQKMATQSHTHINPPMFDSVWNRI